MFSFSNSIVIEGVLSFNFNSSCKRLAFFLNSNFASIFFLSLLIQEKSVKSNKEYLIKVCFSKNPQIHRKAEVGSKS